MVYRGVGNVPYLMCQVLRLPGHDLHRLELPNKHSSQTMTMIIKLPPQWRSSVV